MLSHRENDIGIDWVNAEQISPYDKPTENELLQILL